MSVIFVLLTALGFMLSGRRQSSAAPAVAGTSAGSAVLCELTTHADSAAVRMPDDVPA